MVRQIGANGSKNVLYHETWVNGVLNAGQELSSVVTAAGQDEVIAIGKNSDLSIGSGNLAYPVEHPEIICEYGCYAGFESIDFINRYIDGEMYWLWIQEVSKRRVIQMNWVTM